MIVQQQNDGTWLAEQKINGRLQIAEGETQTDAYKAMIDRMEELFMAEAERLLVAARTMQSLTEKR